MVTWGVLAYLAIRWRRTGALLAAATACSVGLTTVYLGTHWVTDVLAGWAAGLLVLLSLPLLEPPLVTAAEQRLVARQARRRGIRSPAATPPSSVPPPRRAPRG